MEVSGGIQAATWILYWEDDYCMVVELDSALPDEDSYTISLESELLSRAGCTLEGDNRICITALAGDTNDSRSVNAQDMLAVRAHNGEPVESSNARYDVNCNGAINASDMLAVRARNGHSAPLCPQ